MMKRIVLLQLLSFFAISTYAQPVFLGFKGGLGLSNMVATTKTPVSESYKFNLSGGAGVFTEIELNNTLSLRLGIDYSGQGGKKDGLQAMPINRLINGYAKS